MAIYTPSEIQIQLKDINAKLHASNLDEQTKKRLEQHKTELTMQLGQLLSGKKSSTGFNFKDDDINLNLHNDASMAKILGLDLSKNSAQNKQAINAFRNAFLRGVKEGPVKEDSPTARTSKMPEAGSVEVVKVLPLPESEKSIDENPPYPHPVDVSGKEVSPESEKSIDENPPYPHPVDVSE